MNYYSRDQVYQETLEYFKGDSLATDVWINKYALKDSDDKIYEKSDIISLHCPLLKETEYLINSETISQMKDGVMIINTGRGGLIKTSDLVEGLKSSKIGYAGLDVYEEESDYFFEDFSEDILTDDTLARLLTFNNVTKKE